MKTKYKKILSVLLATIICLSSFSIGFVVSAATIGTVYQIDLPRGDEPNKDGWGHPALRFKNGWFMNDTDFTTAKSIDVWAGPACYCIELGASIHTGDELTKKGEDFWRNYPSSYNDILEPDDIKTYVGRVLFYGYTGNISAEWTTDNATGADQCAHYFATQLLIWETLVGERDLSFNHVAVPSGYNRVTDIIGSDHPLRSKIFAYYNSIETSVKTHKKIPSFMKNNTATAQTVELTWNGSEYTTTLTDSNNVLSKYDFSASGLTFSKNGNKLTISATKAPTSDVVVTADKTSGSKRCAVITWTDNVISPNGGIQDVITYGEEINDPVYGYLKVKVSYGSCKIVKESEDGVVNNIKFHIKGGSIDQDVTTNSNGVIQIDNLAPGKYTITEYTADKYETQSAQTVTVQSGQTATVTFSNVLKRGDLKVTKTSEDGLVEGIKFKLTGTSLSGKAINLTATTNASGVATFKDVLIGTGYVIEEIGTAVRYVVPDNQTGNIEWNKVTNKSFENKLKKFRVTVTKEDSETKTPQGDASLAGAVYGIYKGGTLIDRYTTDANGQFTTKYYVCGTDWTIKEISASEGYLVNSATYNVGADAKDYTVEYNSTKNTVKEQVIKGKVAIIKHSDDGSTQIETPESEAQFQIYLKSAGSYANAKSSERDVLNCNRDGFAESKNLPYGIYTVHQTKGKEGSEFMSDFDVYISENENTYRYLINNAPFKAYLKVTKVDKETGKTVAYAGAGFEIYAPNGEKVSQTFTYPKKTTIDVFYTNDEGYLITPEKLGFGSGYKLVEVQAPYGYVLDSTPIEFDITRGNSTLEDALTIVKVQRDNIAQKGVIEITKSGEVFSSVTALAGASVDENGTVSEIPTTYTPNYEAQNLKGAVYEIYAAEDIITLDGTVRAKKGTLVNTVTTNDNGIAKSKQLYLGKYIVKEKTAPNTMVLNAEEFDVELVYAGQNVKVTKSALSVFNERQKVTLALAKSMQKDEVFKLGDNGEIQSVTFGTFADEEITAADGTKIPKDGLVCTGSCDKDGNISFNCDLPIGFKWYAKEISTDKHYILSDKKFEFNTNYAGQDTAVIDIKLNDGEPIENKLIYGSVKGYKFDRETEEPIKDVAFGLFRGDETEFTKETAILTSTTDENGIFEFNNIPFGAWIVRELKPVEGYLENTDIHHIDIDEKEKVIKINVANDRIPEMKTTATVDGEKEICATEVFTLTDTIEYKHLIPGKEYVVKGILMDKSTGKALMIGGCQITAETSFVPEQPSGTVDVTFEFDSKYLKAETDIVVFEKLYKDGKELAVHADINDEGQTVKVRIPEIRTSAKVNDKKEVKAKGVLTVIDTVTYKNLTVGKEYVVRGILMDKSTGKPFEVNGHFVEAEAKFTPKKSSGTVKLEFKFDASGLTKETELVVFETLYRENVDIAVHADINDEGQTVKITIPKKETPKTGDDRNYGFWIGLAAIGIGGCIAFVILRFKKKNEDE